MVKAQRHAAADLPHDGTSGDWYFDVTKSGGYLIEQSVHNLDLCNWVIGSHPLRACGFGGILLYKNDPPGRTIFDCGSLTYEYPKGVKMSFTQNVFHPASMPNGNQYVYVYGTKGAVDLMNAVPCILPGEAVNRWCWRPSSRKTSSRILRHSTTRSSTARRPRWTSRSGPRRHSPLFWDMRRWSRKKSSTGAISASSYKTQ